MLILQFFDLVLVDNDTNIISFIKRNVLKVIDASYSFTSLSGCMSVCGLCMVISKM